MTKVIGLDLDGIIIGRPPGIPKSVIEYLYRDHSKKDLSYRFPCLWEQKLRRLSHLPEVRPPIWKNLKIIKNLRQRRIRLGRKKNYQLFVISGRFSFLEDLTFAWLNKYQTRECFQEIYLNKNNLQPHIFKEKMLKKIKVDLFIDDDFDTVVYLASRFPQIQFYYYTENNHHKTDLKNVTKIADLEKILI